jgi:hypothetical protein
MGEDIENGQKAKPEEMLSDEKREGLKKQEEDEFELTPEIEAKIMEKVQDINKYGVALSRCSLFSEEYKLNNFKTILQYGLLGSTRNLRSGRVTVNEWVSDYRKNKSTFNFFNIMGRNWSTTQEREDGRYEIEKDANWSKSFYMTDSKDIEVGIIFDIAKFKESAPVPEVGGPTREMPRHTFAMDGGSFWREKFGDKTPQEVVELGLTNQTRQELDINGFPITPDENYGFVLSDRISPKVMRGIVISVPKRTNPDTLLRECVETIAAVQVEIRGDDPKLLLPVYDTRGNLLWPKQMSYKEIKQFGAENDAKDSAEADRIKVQEPLGEEDSGASQE